MAQQWVNFDHVKQNADISAVLTHYDLGGRRRGDEIKIHCPFHDDRRPSCSVNAHEGHFHCFGCNEEGNILEFVCLLEDGDPDNTNDLRAAAITLADISGIDPAPANERRRERSSKGCSKNNQGNGRRTRQTVDRKPKPANRRNKARGRKANKPREADPVPSPKRGPNKRLGFKLKLDPTHPFLSVDRGLDEELVELFGLGFCDKGMMAGRICIPIHNDRGELVAYSGRWVGEDDPPAGEDKYKLPKDFSKNQVLFNLHRLGDVEEVTVVEGFWSTFRLHALGHPVIALMGTSLSTEQIAMLRLRQPRLNLLLDGDAAGWEATETLTWQLASSGLFVRSFMLPEGVKPDTIDESDLLELIGQPISAGKGQ